MPAHYRSADRRDFLKGSAAVAAACLSSVTTPIRAQELPGLGTTAFSKTGGFDLADPRDRLLARIKVMASLTGERTYIYSVSRHMLAPPNKPSYQFFAEFDLRTIWIEPATEPGGLPHTRALFTKIPVDPISFEPISEYYNPYLGRTLPVEPVLYAGSGLPIDLDSPEPNIIYQQDKPHYRLGDDIIFINFDPKEGDGSFQPHTDSAMLRANHAQLMDPSNGWVGADYTLNAVRKASAYPWSGITKTEEAQVLSMKLGRKVGRTKDLPPEFLRTIGSQFPERL